MRWLKLLLFLIILFYCAEASSTSEAYQLMYENRFLKSEYQLAKISQTYFVFDLVQKKIQVKLRGSVLKEFSIDSFHLWGKPILPIPYPLIKKKTILEPKRPRITPGIVNKEDFNYESYAFSVNEMPSRYRLFLGEGFTIYVRPKSEGILSTFLNGCSSLKSFLIRPLLALWESLNRKPFGAIDIYLTEEESKSLYWALQEGQTCILYYGIS